MKTQTDYNKIVKIERNGEGEILEFTVLNYSFMHSDGFKGLTGSTFAPISTEYIEEALKGFQTVDDLQAYWYDATGDLLRIDDAECFLSDPYSEEFLSVFLHIDFSHCCDWDEYREELNLSEDEYPYFNCTGGGRCFSAGDTFNYAPELEYLLKKYEN